MKQNNLLAYILIVLVTANVADADLLDQFRKDYPAAAANLDVAYAHSRAIGTLTRTDPDGNFLWNFSFEDSRRGTAVRHLRTYISSRHSEDPAGSVFACGGPPQQFFQIFRVAGGQPFEIKSFGALSDFDPFTRVNLRPLFGSTCMDDVRVSDHMPNKDWDVKSARMDVLDDADVCRVNFTSSAPRNLLLEGWACFSLPSWALVGWHVTYKKMSIPPNDADKNPILDLEGRIRYKDGTKLVPKVRALHRWANTSAKRVDEFTSDVTKLDFVDLPEADFHIEAFGLKPPPGPITPGQK